MKIEESLFSNSGRKSLQNSIHYRNDNFLVLSIPPNSFECSFYVREMCFSKNFTVFPKTFVTKIYQKSKLLFK